MAEDVKDVPADRPRPSGSSALRFTDLDSERGTSQRSESASQRFLVEQLMRRKMAQGGRIFCAPTNPSVSFQSEGKSVEIPAPLRHPDVEQCELRAAIRSGRHRENVAVNEHHGF